MTAKYTNAKGSVFYDVEADTDLRSNAAAVPALTGILTDSAFALPLRNSLNFAHSASAVPAEADLDPASEKRFGEFGNGLLASL